MSALANGEYVVVKNRYGTSVQGNVINATDKKIMIMSPDGRTLNWIIEESDTIQKLAEKNMSSKQVEAEANKAKLRTLKWKQNSLGSDPELFFIDSKTESVIPAFEFLPSQEDSHGAPFWDGFQAEFNISSGSCLDQRVSSMQSFLIDINNRAKKYNKRAMISPDSTVEIAEEVFKNVESQHLEFGCSPSFNVYDIKGLELDGTKTRIRNAGGHLHFGLVDSYKNEKFIKACVKNLDKILGVACVALFQNYDNPIRRQYYGLAGEYRVPKHGLEYRTLTNAWIRHPRLMYIVFELARKCIALEEQGLSHLWDSSEEEVIECINNCDVNMAKNILLINEEMFRSILGSMCYNDETKINVVFNAIMQGAETLMTTPDNIILNWHDCYAGQIAKISAKEFPYLSKRIKY